ncbi:hypothetical protein K490DRAFT_68682 [Saccharata proteae CBS 121410]|uniref:Uncharacterized protein n=1 Tax=Saccharata proteae CBS 121410 TaxID=1314787 RepID=A0A9P4HPJ1_9PEZI|nr:hypothetical protein K490DRAFT_68682 [Saccharata proteae CBS 121410]
MKLSELLVCLAGMAAAAPLDALNARDANNGILCPDYCAQSTELCCKMYCMMADDAERKGMLKYVRNTPISATVAGPEPTAPPKCWPMKGAFPGRPKANSKDHGLVGTVGEEAPVPKPSSEVANSLEVSGSLADKREVAYRKIPSVHAMCLELCYYNEYLNCQFCEGFEVMQVADTSAPETQLEARSHDPIKNPTLRDLCYQQCYMNGGELCLYCDVYEPGPMKRMAEIEVNATGPVLQLEKGMQVADTSEPGTQLEARSHGPVTNPTLRDMCFQQCYRNGGQLCLYCEAYDSAPMKRMAELEVSATGPQPQLEKPSPTEKATWEYEASQIDLAELEVALSLVDKAAAHPPFVLMGCFEKCLLHMSGEHGPAPPPERSRPEKTGPAKREEKQGEIITATAAATHTPMVTGAVDGASVQNGCPNLWSCAEDDHICLSCRSSGFVTVVGGDNTM